MWLGHADGRGREVYVRGALGFETGACYMRRPQAEVHVASFASWRTPGAAPRCLWMVDPNSPAGARPVQSSEFMPTTLHARSGARGDAARCEPDRQLSALADAGQAAA